ncbi:hypothetical protein BGZ70_010694, partial [Mortierella alpina]
AHRYIDGQQTPSSSTAAVTPRAPTKRRKRERPAASHPYTLVPMVPTGERAETSSASQGLDSPPSPSVPHSGTENRRARPRGSVHRRLNHAERAVHPVSPSSTLNASEVQSEEAAVHALMYMQHEREGTEPCSPLQHSQQLHVHQQQHQHQHQFQHQYEHHYEHQYGHPHGHHHHHEHQHQHGQNHDLILNHTLSQTPHANSWQDRSPDHLTNAHHYPDGQQTSQDLHLQAHGYAPRHHHTSDAFNGNNFTNAHDQDTCATYQEPPVPATRGFQSHHQHHGPPNPQHCAHHAQPPAPAEMHFQQGHYPTRPLIIPREVIDRTLHLHQAFYEWGFVEGFGSVFDQTLHDHHQHDHQRQVEYQKRWGMYERGLQVGIALAQEQQQQPQDDPAHWDPSYSPPPSPSSPSQWQPSQFTTPAPLSPPRAQQDAAPIILPALPATGPLPRVPLGQVTLPALQLQSTLPESLDQDWCVLPKIMTFPPTGTSPPASE